MEVYEEKFSAILYCKYELVSRYLHCTKNAPIYIVILYKMLDKTANKHYNRNHEQNVNTHVNEYS